MSSRSTIINLMARRIGARTGTFTSGSTQYAVLGNDFGSTGDDSIHVGDHLWMLDAAAAADKDRIISEWDDSEGKALWVRARTNAATSSESYIVLPAGDWNRQDFYTAINDRLANIRRSVVSVIPTMTGVKQYRLNQRTWIRHHDDVDAVYLRRSPNLLDNAQFDVWGAGAADQPSSWVFSGAGATLRRTGMDEIIGQYGVELTRAGSDVSFTQTVGTLNDSLVSQAVTFSMTADCGAASVARLSIYDGVSTQYSSYHTGGGSPERLSITATLSALADTCRVQAHVQNTNSTVTFSDAAFVLGSSIPDPLESYGDAAYDREDIDGHVLQNGESVVLELPVPLAVPGQILVVSAQPYPALSSDSDETDCPDDVIVPGALYELARRMPQGVLRDRLDRIMAQSGREFGIEAASLRQRPNPRPPFRRVVTGA